MTFVFLVGLALLGLVYGYPAWRLLTDLPIAAPVRLAAGVAVAGLAALPIAHLLWLRSGPERWRRSLAWVIYLGLGGAVILFDTVLVRDLLGLLVRLGSAAGALPARLADAPGLRAASAWMCLPIGAVLLALGVRGARRPRPRHVCIPVADLPADLEGLRIVQLTDLHVGPTIRRSFVARVVDQVETLQPDLIVFTGDLADGAAADLRDEVAPLARLSAPLGTWFSTGNHDYYYDPAGWLAVVDALGFGLVSNGHRVLTRNGARIVLGGLPDPAGAEARPGDPAHGADAAAVFAGAPEGLRLLLAHQPRQALAAADTGAALTLSGHTHGGQLWPWGLLVRWQQGLVAGLHRRRHGDGGWVYVSRGIGTWGPPVRLGAPAEIACLTLERA